MPIKKETPLVIPAEAEKTLPHTWLSELIVNAPNASDGYMSLNLIAFDSDSDEDPNHENSKRMDLDFWEVIANVPEAAAAMQSVFDAIPAIESYYKEGILEMVPVEEDEEEVEGD
tara:strand:- start:1426 stop:1770 length:345 start_codon:yes stop_codon:yes gene_type:complete